jgi:hypothetical protein
MCGRQMRIVYSMVFKLNVNKVVKECDNWQLFVHSQQSKCYEDKKKN